jgi:hypothetical protein
MEELALELEVAVGSQTWCVTSKSELKSEDLYCDCRVHCLRFVLPCAFEHHSEP